MNVQENDEVCWCDNVLSGTLVGKYRRDSIAGQAAWPPIKESGVLKSQD